MKSTTTENQQLSFLNPQTHLKKKKVLGKNEEKKEKQLWQQNNIKELQKEWEFNFFMIKREIK